MSSVLKQSRSKYKNKKVKVDGIWFDSKDESRYYLYLQEKKNNGEIKDFTLQPVFVLQEGYRDFTGKKILPIKYKADFTVIHNDGSEEVVDIKGYPTPAAKLKRKMFMCKYPDVPFYWIVRNLKHGDKDGWIEYFELEKKRKESR